jgi:hypothetical protein
MEGLFKPADSWNRLLYGYNQGCTCRHLFEFCEGVLLTPSRGMFGGLLAMSSFQASKYIISDSCIGFSLTKLKEWAKQ